MSVRSRAFAVAVLVLISALYFPGAVMAQQEVEKQTAAINGIEIYYETAGEGEVLLLLHGYMVTGRLWDPFVDEFSSRYRLIIPDLRGHGGSSNPGGVFTMRQSALDMLALLDYLGVDRFKAIGTSAGAMTLLHMATMQPDRIEAMILVGSGTYLSDDCRGLLGKYTSDTYPAAEFNRLRTMHRRGDEQIRNLLDGFQRMVRTYDDINFTPPQLATIKARTLLVHGDKDYCFPPSMALELYSSIPHTYLWIIPNGSHVPIHGKWEPVFTQNALEFLGGEWEKS